MLFEHGVRNNSDPCRGVDKLSPARVGAPVIFDERETAALAYVDAMTDSCLSADDRLLARLRCRFNEDEVIELTALVGFQKLSSKFNAALGVQAHGCCAPPEPKEYS